MIRQIEIDPAVFNPAYLPYLDCNSRTQIYYGGSGSGKSVFVVGQRTIYDLLSGGRNYLVCRQVGRTIRNSVYNEILKIIVNWGVGSLFNVNKTDMVITCSNGYQILFAGLDDPEKMKSITPAKGVITDIIIEEATETERGTVKQLIKRQRGGSDSTNKRLVLLFNPIMQSHWIYEEYFSKISWSDKQTEYRSDELSILKTIYKDNKFLTSEDIKDLENETDKYYYDVYTLGNWGVLGNVIFTNYRFEDLSGMRDQFTNHRIGLDFGFSSDPAAMPVMHYDKPHKTLYIYDELYERGLTNDILAEEVIKLIGRRRVICDSSEPKSIQELRNHNVNAYGAKKGKDSVMFGIQWLQQQTVIIDPRCVNTKNEWIQYKWKEDKDGNSIRQPIEKNNHIIDGVRYGCEEDMIEYKAESGDSPLTL